MPTITGDIRKDRIALRDAIASVKLEGATAGTSPIKKWDNPGEPNKCVIVAQMDGGSISQAFCHVLVRETFDILQPFYPTI